MPVSIVSACAAENIYHYNPNAKIIICLREPVSFLRSLHYQNLYNLDEDQPDFMTALALEEARRAGRSLPVNCTYPSLVQYPSLVDYGTHLERFLEYFPAEQIKVFLFDQIVENMKIVFDEYQQFIGIEDLDQAPMNLLDQNKSHTLRFVWLRKLILRPAVKKFLYQTTPHALMPLADSISGKVFNKEQHQSLVKQM